jgi:hypothetical protein
LLANNQTRSKEFNLLIGTALLLTVYYYSNIPLDTLPFVAPIVLLFFFLDAYVFKKTLSQLSQAESQNYQSLESIEQALLIVVGQPLSTLFKPFFSTIFYAFLARRHSDPLEKGINKFSYQKSSNAKDMFWVIAIAQVPTLPLIHLFVETEINSAIAWVVTALTAWTVIHYLAQINATKFNPLYLRNSVLFYRHGLSWKATIPLAQIKEARSLTLKDNIDSVRHFVSPLGSNKNVILEFEKPIVFVGQLGIFKRKRTALISLDNPTQFLEALNVQRNIVTEQTH